MVIRRCTCNSDPPGCSSFPGVISISNFQFFPTPTFQVQHRSMYVTLWLAQTLSLPFTAPFSKLWYNNGPMAQAIQYQSTFIFLIDSSRIPFIALMALAQGVQTASSRHASPARPNKISSARKVHRRQARLRQIRLAPGTHPFPPGSPGLAASPPITPPVRMCGCPGQVETDTNLSVSSLAG